MVSLDRLSNQRWYRFRRDMTTEAVDPGTHFRVIPYEDFQSLRARCKTIGELD